MTKSRSEKTMMNEAVARFCHESIKEPLCFFSEADLQGMLYARLCETFPGTFDTEVRRGPNSEGMYRTGRVHREYGAEEGKRTDISVFSIADIGKISDPNLKAAGEYLKPLFAVELGTEKTSATGVHAESDKIKLARAQVRGYLIHIYRDTTKADSGTARRANKETSIQKRFKEPFEQAFMMQSKLCCLGFVVRIGRAGELIRGKCLMYAGPTVGWKKINLNNIEREVLDFLS